MRIALSFFFVFLQAGTASAQAHQDAVAPMGFFGGTLTVRSVDDPHHSGVAHRTLIVTGADGQRLSTRLNDGGGAAENQALNLYKEGNADRFLLLSQKDCVEIDPARVTATVCAPRKACDFATQIGRTYVGRFDWMNGFDPPNGRFGFRFRFLPAYDAGCAP